MHSMHYVLASDGMTPVSWPVHDEDGRLVPQRLLEWSRWADTDSRRLLGFTEVGGLRVSTVFLGFDHDPRGEAPVLWETMVFEPVKLRRKQVGWRELDSARYRAHAQALAGHEAMVKRVRLAVLFR